MRKKQDVTKREGHREGGEGERKRDRCDNDEIVKKKEKKTL